MDTNIAIGKVKLKSKYILAPMAGFSDIGFRTLAYKFGAGLCCTEMVSAKGLVYNSENSKLLLSTDNDEPIKAAQIFGSEIPFIEKVLKKEELKKFDIIDFNFGCPMKKIVSNGEGSALLKNPMLCYDIIKCCTDNTNQEITAKIRIGYFNDEKNAVEVSKLIEKAGAKAITVHGRTRDQFYSGKVDFDMIRQVVEAVNIPVFGNGNVIDLESANEMFEKTGCKGIAIGRAAVGAPYIFSVLNGKKATYNLAYLIKSHISKMLEYFPEKVVVNYMKKHLAAYLFGIPNAKEIKAKIYALNTIDDLMELIESRKELFYRNFDI